MEGCRVEAAPCNLSEPNGMMGATREGDIGLERGGVAQVVVYERARQTQCRLLAHSRCCGERGEGRVDRVRTQIHASAYSFDLTLREKVVNLVLPQACGSSVAEREYGCQIRNHNIHLSTLCTLRLSVASWEGSDAA
jgi:hypothetical protein